MALFSLLCYLHYCFIAKGTHKQNSVNVLSFIFQNIEKKSVMESTSETLLRKWSHFRILLTDVNLRAL